MFQTGGLSRTGGFLCPAATGLLADFYSAPRFEQRINEKKKKNRWMCEGVQVSVPRSVSPQERFFGPFDPRTMAARWAVFEQAWGIEL